MLETISIIIAAISVAAGMTAWRRTIVGQRRIELAEEVLALFYEARDTIRMIRSPGSFGSEGSSRKRQENETDQEAEILDRAYIVFERYEKKIELFSKIQSLKYRFMAYFGQDSISPFSDLDRVVSRILTSGRMLAHHWHRQNDGHFRNEEEFQRHLDRMHEQEAIFWEMGPDDDEIRPQVDALIDAIERTCGGIINPKSSICRDLRSWASSAQRYWLCRE